MNNSKTSYRSSDVYKTVIEAIETLQSKQKTVFTAESCTGGLIAKLLTDVPGSSKSVLGGVVTYTNQMKINLLGVNAKTIEEYTEVSEPTVKEMALCAKKLSGSDIAVASTGFAGPGGGNDVYPVGTVFIAVAYKEMCIAKELNLDGSRDDVRTSAANEALKLVIKAVNS